MTVKAIRARGTKGSESVEQLVQKARAQAGVERILVVYGEQTAHIYVEADQPPRPSRVNARVS